MADILLGGKTYPGIDKVRLDTPEEDTVDFTPYEETFAAGKAEGIEEGYTNGKTDGIEEGYEDGKTDGVAEGIRSEYDRFWDAYQNNGNRTIYRSAFVEQWTDSIFVPKYNITPMGTWSASQMFKLSKLTDLPALLKRAGVVLDTSKATHMDAMFQEANCTVPCIDMTSAINIQNMFYYYYGQTIEKLIVHEEIEFGTSFFTRADNLKNITFEGTIGKSVSLQWSPLTVDSIRSVVSHLSDSAAGKTVTFKLSAVNSAFETAEGAADGSASEAWAALIATKSNWTISCV